MRHICFAMVQVCQRSSHRSPGVAAGIHLGQVLPVRRLHPFLNQHVHAIGEVHTTGHPKGGSLAGNLTELRQGRVASRHLVDRVQGQRQGRKTGSEGVPNRNPSRVFCPMVRVL